MEFIARAMRGECAVAFADACQFAGEVGESVGYQMNDVGFAPNLAAY